MPYRIDVAPQARAGCKNKECKDAAVKIQKGELRFATQVTIDEHTSWSYKHWGCATPAQIQNLIDDSGGDTDMVDGFEELPEDAQEKVKFALANGHVPDEDWKGDVECNRPGAKGFRVKLTAAQKKAAKKAEEDGEDEAPKAKAKRSRPTKDDEEDEAPAPKKARGKPGKAAAKEEPQSEDDEPKAKVTKAARGKKAAVKEDAEPSEPKTKRGKKAAAAPKEVMDDEDEDEVQDQDQDADEPEPPKAKAKKSKKAAVPKKAVEEGDAQKAPKAKRGKKQAPAADSDKPAPKRSGRARKPVDYEE